MTTGKMHANEVDTDATLVGRLLAAQFPQWAGLPIQPIASAGTVHVLYRLGDDMVVRLPRIGVADEELDKEFHWLPRLAPLLPCAIPLPLGRGLPGEGYPFPWSVYRWLEGENPQPGQLEDPAALALDLAAFIQALRRLDPAGAPPSQRGQRTLASMDAFIRASIAQAQGLIDTAAVTAAWEAALRTPPWEGPAVWVHADLLPGNLLVNGGRLSAVIDFGSLGTGDPASDLSVAWTLFPTEARTIFREALGADDATWQRARGLALAIMLAALPYYQHTNPVFAEVARYTIGEVLAEFLHSNT
ncbi:MAG: aminoglycoside phosphotransferase family protein [Chloroflexaceae bacterium]|jgi:aminoglycoside phosphotransferase (APT) family kinase protein|nr:aminoglycoside phosphotransferase family protein [Chloroflexaceae bacterium]